MGRDKALLPAGDESLVERVASRVHAAAGSVTLIGAPERYQSLGLAVAADLVENCGPIGGVFTALKITSADWNLMIACDMPDVSTELLREMLGAAADSNAASDAACLVAQTADGWHPLCAVYHRKALPAVEAAINRKSFKMHDLIETLDALPWPVREALLVRNVNTPAEWEAARTR